MDVGHQRPAASLANLVQLLADLAQVIDQQHPAVLVFFDLDGFKTYYNDTFGHSQGDLLLARLGHKMAAAVTAGAAYRLGGDEFCALCTTTSIYRRHWPVCVPRGGRRAIRSWFPALGFVRLAAEAKSVTDALRTADTRRYRNKRVGRTSAAQQTADLAASVIAEYDEKLHEHANDVAQNAEQSVGGSIWTTPS